MSIVDLTLTEATLLSRQLGALGWTLVQSTFSAGLIAQLWSWKSIQAQDVVDPPLDSMPGESHNSYRTRGLKFLG